MDYGLLDSDTPERKYSPVVVKSVKRTPLWGMPDPKYISTAYAERPNLTTRMQMRRFTRLTNALSRKAEKLARAVALTFIWYNFCRKHMTSRTRPGIAPALSDRIWMLGDMAVMADRVKELKAA